MSTVIIGEQEWVVENLNEPLLADDTEIPLITDAAVWAATLTPGKRYYSNTTDPVLQEKYGYLYNFYAIEAGIKLPAGWRIPTEADFVALQAYLIANGYNWDDTTTGNKIAKSLASTSGWSAKATVGVIGNDQTSNNDTGLAIEASGFSTPVGAFTGKSEYTALWAASNVGIYGCRLLLSSGSASTVIDYNAEKRYGYSIRLIKITYLTVSYDTNGGSAVSSESVADGDTATIPSNPTKLGSTFENWYSDAGLTNVFDFNTAVTADITLYAKWVSRPFHVFLFIGQSNMAGGYATAPHISRVDDSIFRSVKNGTVDACLIGPPAATSTMLIPTLNKLRDTYPNDNLVGVNMAIGNTGLVVNGTNGKWSDRNVGSLYYNAVTLLNTTMTYLTSQGYTVTFDGVFWHQGETDAVNSVSKSAYLAELLKLVDDIRVSCDTPNLHFFAFQIGRFLTVSGTDISWPAIRQAHVEFDGTANGLNHMCGVTIDLPLVDVVHYETAGLARCGLIAGWTYAQVKQGLPYRGPRINSVKYTNKDLKHVRVFCSLPIAGEHVAVFCDHDGNTPISVGIIGSSIDLVFENEVTTVGYLSKRAPDITDVIAGTDDLGLLLEPTEQRKVMSNRRKQSSLNVGISLSL